MKSELNLRQILDHLYDGLYFVDRERRITYWNHAAERITGYKAEEVLGLSCADNILVHVDGQGNELCRGLWPLAAVMADGKPRDTEVYLHHKKGHRVPVSVRVTPMKDAQGRIIGGIELFTDLSSREALRLQVAELEKLAMVDGLTQLPNRRHVESQIRARLSELSRTGVSFGLLFMDIDRFKHFNDQHGHEMGDRVLCVVANTLAASIRPFDTVGRWGGEEFVALFPGTTVTGLTEIAERLRMLIEHSRISSHTRQLSVTVSIGGILARDVDTPATVVKRADALMYASKERGRNRITIEEAHPWQSVI